MEMSGKAIEDWLDRVRKQRVDQLVVELEYIGGLSNRCRVASQEIDPNKLLLASLGDETGR